MLGFVVFIIFAIFGATKGSPVVGPNIVGGVNASQGEFPFMISLKAYGYHMCGGSIIAPQWVLTAGHCVLDGDDSDLQVYYGNISLNDQVYTQNVNEHKVKVIKQIRHPNFTNIETSQKLLIRNDLALLQLEHPINYSKLAQPIKLPTQDESVPVNRTATLTGWGYTDSYYDQPETLQKVNLTIFDYPICDYYNAQLNFSDAQNICAGNIDNTQGQCNGDSGGPLFIDGVQWGIVSWSIKPCISAPGVFTRTSVFVDWIKSVTGI